MEKEEKKLDVEKEYKETIERFVNKKESKQPEQPTEKKPERKSACRQHATNSTQYFRTESLFNKTIGEKVSPVGLAFPARR
jgi:hypothetical protein